MKDTENKRLISLYQFKRKSNCNNNMAVTAKFDFFFLNLNKIFRFLGIRRRQLM